MSMFIKHAIGLELEVRVVNQHLIPFGYVAILVSPPGIEDSNLLISIPVLVSSLSLERPLLGFSVVEELILGKQKRLTLLCRAISIPTEKAEGIVSCISATRACILHAFLRVGYHDVAIPAEWVALVKCHVSFNMNPLTALLCSSQTQRVPPHKSLMWMKVFLKSIINSSQI